MCHTLLRPDVHKFFIGTIRRQNAFLFYLGKNFVGHSYPVQSAGCVVELKGQYRLRAYLPATSHHGMLAHLHKSNKYLADHVCFQAIRSKLQ